MLKVEKKQVVNKLESVFNDSEAVVVFHYKGLNVDELEELRNKMRQQSVAMQVIKNTLAIVALRNTDNKDKEDLFNGPSAVAWGQDPVAVAKVLSDFSKKHDKLVLIGGIYNSNKLDKEAVKHLANLPSLPELQSKLIAIIQTPATKIAQVLSRPASMLATVLDQYSQK